ncbi:hypothetical protein ASF32_01445 [Methylobacterium sp. Leaf91]|nr:hypothetical protein ASF24_08510 [Methylobacterium sp. Leaf86]KQP00576.1 hypothetical protein ASF32_01445 [Methylobacterium sp. Leaf91]
MASVPPPFGRCSQRKVTFDAHGRRDKELFAGEFCTHAIQGGGMMHLTVRIAVLAVRSFGSGD